MPRVAFRLSEAEHRLLLREAEVRGVSVSELVRDALSSRAANVEERLDDLEKRVSRVERVAGLV